VARDRASSPRRARPPPRRFETHERGLIGPGKLLRLIRLDCLDGGAELELLGEGRARRAGGRGRRGGGRGGRRRSGRCERSHASKRAHPSLSGRSQSQCADWSRRCAAGLRDAQRTAHKCRFSWLLQPPPGETRARPVAPPPATPATPRHAVHRQRANQGMLLQFPIFQRAGAGRRRPPPPRAAARGGRPSRNLDPRRPRDERTPATHISTSSSSSSIPAPPAPPAPATRRAARGAA
jgi:hypothetical protein